MLIGTIVVAVGEQRVGSGTRPARGLSTNLTGVLLAELRVLDLCDGDADAVTRLLADLGADVLKVEPPGGNAGRSRRPLVAGASIAFTLNNANKRGCVLDPRRRRRP